MPKFFVPGDQISGDKIEITGEDALHISRSLRMAAYDEIIVSDMRGSEFRCILETFYGGRVGARIVERYTVSTEPPAKITLYQAFPKGDKLDLIVQKAVELGVSAIVPFESERCISRPDRKAAERKVARLQRISLEAAKQCGRGIVPSVEPPLSFDRMLTSAAAAGIPLFCYEGEGTESLHLILSRFKRHLGDPVGELPEISVVIGPEGGFGQSEVERAKEAGLFCAALGKRILRCETASIFVLACIAYEYEI